MSCHAKDHTDCNPRPIEVICEHHYELYLKSFYSVEVANQVSLQVKTINNDGGFDPKRLTLLIAD